jgi:hypothetical protein
MLKFLSPFTTLHYNNLRSSSGLILSLVSFEHVIPERFDFLNVTSFAVHGHAGKCEAFGELTFQADLLVERARGLPCLVIAQPQIIRQESRQLT